VTDSAIIKRFAARPVGYIAPQPIVPIVCTLNS
jgi:hypothetical protein